MKTDRGYTIRISYFDNYGQLNDHKLVYGINNQSLIDLAEKVFGFDINFDAIQSENYQPPKLNSGSRIINKFDFAENNNFKIFSKEETTSKEYLNNKKLFKDINSRELLFADDSDTTNQTLLTFTDGTSFIPQQLKLPSI